MGICYSYNMQGYNSIFNNGTLSSDFDLYIRKGIKNVTDVNLSQTFDDRNEPIQWTLEDGYLTTFREFPYRIKKGINDKMKLNMNFDMSQIFNLCENLRHSYMMILHMPNEMPTKYHEYTYLGLHSNHIISLTASSIAYDQAFHGYSSSNRDCYFQNEKELKFFKTYTKPHCIIECMANYTLKSCGCVKFSMPRAPGVKVCGLDQATCIRKSTRTWSEKDSFLRANTTLCQCLPSCYSVKYSIKMINHVDFEMKISDHDEYEIVSEFLDTALLLSF